MKEKKNSNEGGVSLTMPKQSLIPHQHLGCSFVTLFYNQLRLLFTRLLI